MSRGFSLRNARLSQLETPVPARWGAQTTVLRGLRVSLPLLLFFSGAVAGVQRTYKGTRN